MLQSIRLTFIFLGGFSSSPSSSLESTMVTISEVRCGGYVTTWYPSASCSENLGCPRDRSVCPAPGRCFALSSIFQSVSVPNRGSDAATPPIGDGKIQGETYCPANYATVICVVHHLWAVRLTIFHWQPVPKFMCVKQ
jgi:hypothetical protein